MMNLVTPDSWNIKIDKTKDGKYKIIYEESFDSQQEELFENTIKLIKSLGINAKIKKNKISYEFTGDLSQIASIMTAEFAGVSDVGKMTLVELITLAGPGMKAIQELFGSK